MKKLRVVVYRWMREVAEGSTITVADLFESEKKEVKKPKISQSKSIKLGTRSCRLFEHFHHGHRVTRLGHLFHHFLSLFELIQKLVNVGWSGAATLGYAAAPATVQNLRALSFFTGHRPYDSFNTLNAAVIQVTGGHLFAELAHTRNHLHD